MNDFFSLFARALAEGETAVVEGENVEQAGSMGASLAGMLIPLLAMGLIFYFMLIRPQRKKDKKVKEMLDSLKPGDRVTTIGGIYGTIKGIRDDTIVLTVGMKNGEPTEMTIARWAIRNVEEISVENEGEMLN